MIFYLHYILLTSGLSGTSVLLAVYFKTYSDASQGETGALLMAIPFVSLFIKPIFCSMADRRQAHHLFLMLSLLVMMIGFAPFVVIPFFPSFFEAYPRHSWYLLVVSCLIGASGLGVAWSLGDCLAMNHAQRTGVPFGRMRLMGTLSWGIYGFIIGQINEHPALPKYIPAFIILHLSVFAELILLALWDRKAFEMVDLLSKHDLKSLTSCDKLDRQQPKTFHRTSFTISSRDGYKDQLDREMESIRMRKKNTEILVDSVPSSLGGTLKLNPKTAKTMFEVLAINNDDELVKRLTGVEQEQELGDNESNTGGPDQQQQKRPSMVSSLAGGLSLKGQSEAMFANLESGQKAAGPTAATPNRNPQLILLKLIFMEDGRVVKYILLFTLFGALVAPINFFFVSIEGLCHERGYNFSQLAGAVLMSQALIETVAFLVVPNLLLHMSRWCLLSIGLAIMATKFVFYAGWYYDDDVSPYWAVLSEWSHGIPYGIFCTILADVSLMFANQSRLFIPELRRLGFLSAEESACKAEQEEEERSIKLALRATMQALFGGFMDGLGVGAGSLLCGLFSDLYSYHIVWQIFATLTVSAFALHLLAETTRSRWSDTFRPRKGTKAHEIMELTRASDEAQRQRRLAEEKQAKLAAETARTSPITTKGQDDGDGGGQVRPV